LGYVRSPATLRARFPSLIHSLTVDCIPRAEQVPPETCCAPTTALALASLCASPDLRRVLKKVELVHMCCWDEAAAAVSAIAACPHLTSLALEWGSHFWGDASRSDVLTPLAQLTGLKQLKVEALEGELPTLPDCPSLTSLAVILSGDTYFPMGNDAILGRLRRLSLEMEDRGNRSLRRRASNDPLHLRADLDAGLWRPHLLTRLQKLHVTMFIHEMSFVAGFDEYVGNTSTRAVWAPLAPTVTELTLDYGSLTLQEFDLDTGLYVGLGVLTGLRALYVKGTNKHHSPVDFGRLHLNRLTFLSVQDYRGPPIDVARFLRLVHVEVESGVTEPLVLSSVAALSQLASLRVSKWPCTIQSDPKPRLNLAQLFGGGRRLAALTGLSFDRVALAWDATVVPGAPTAPEFAARAGMLLPSLRLVKINERVEMEEGVREFVVPAVLALGGG
jgi:hypothetical protein